MWPFFARKSSNQTSGLTSTFTVSLVIINSHFSLPPVGGCVGGEGGEGMEGGGGGIINILTLVKVC